MPLAELTGACQRETGKFMRRESACDAYCFELFRRAIRGHDQAAWDAVFAQYHVMVYSWIRQHPAAAVSREDSEYWVNRTFERFWSAVGPERFESFPGLPAILRYLKLCAHSVLLDEVRAQGRARLEPLGEAGDEPGAALDIEGAAVGQLAGQELWEVVNGELQDESERLVAYLCFVLDLKPREVYERHPDRYASVADVYRVKRNLLDKLRRSPKIREFLG